MKNLILFLLLIKNFYYDYLEQPNRETYIPISQ